MQDQTARATTFALQYLKAEGPIPRFLNADMIATGLSPFSPEEKAALAGRLFLSEMEACIAAEEDFAFETTLSGRGYLKLIDRLHAASWRVELLYFALPNVELSKTRVAERVRHGGHDIPQHDIERRFPRSLRNLLNDYRMRVELCICHMGGGDKAHLVFRQSGDDFTIYDNDLFSSLAALAGTV